MSVVTAKINGVEITTTAGYRMRSGIYAIIHRESQKLYIGSASCLKTRIGYHRSRLRHGSHDNSYLQHAWNAHGESAFTFILCEECSRELLLDREKFWMSQTKCFDRMYGYNLDRIAQRKMHSEETRRKISEANKGKPFTPERLANVRAALKRRGYIKPTYTPEQRLVRSENAVRLWSDPMKRKQAGASKIGKPRSVATKQKLSAFWKKWREAKQEAEGQLCLL